MIAHKDNVYKNRSLSFILSFILSSGSTIMEFLPEQEKEKGKCSRKYCSKGYRIKERRSKESKVVCPGVLILEYNHCWSKNTYDRE